MLDEDSFLFVDFVATFIYLFIYLLFSNLRVSRGGTTPVCGQARVASQARSFLFVSTLCWAGNRKFLKPCLNRQ